MIPYGAARAVIRAAYGHKGFNRDKQHVPCQFPLAHGSADAGVEEERNHVVGPSIISTPTSNFSDSNAPASLGAFSFSGAC
jgi:hypothetical protein